MKKLVHSITCLCLLSQILNIPTSAGQTAVPSGAPVSSSNKVRVGVGLAGEYNNVEANLTIVPSKPLDNFGSTQSQTAKKLQIAPSLELGVTIADDYYLGLFASWRNSGAKNSSRSFIRGSYYFLHDFKLHQYTDILIKPGYKIMPRSMIYGLFGPSIANWSHTSGQYNGFNALVSNFKIDRKTVGLGVGLGFEYIIREKYAISVDYIYHFHRSVSSTQTISYRALQGLAVVNLSGNVLKTVKPSYSTIAARFTYFFNL